MNRLPTLPLKSAIERKANARCQSLTALLGDLSERIPSASRDWWRVVGAPDINRYTADCWAVALGMHPADIWPEWEQLDDVQTRKAERAVGGGSR